MIPRIHKRGTSFKTAAQYILNDPRHQKSALAHADGQHQSAEIPSSQPSAERVSWIGCLNLDGVDPAEAWKAMYETWNDRTALKRATGQDLRGRDNDKPVMHYTLAWHPDERPSEQQMRQAVVSSLKAMKLDEHQVLMAAHTDKDHAHVHVIVNTVHPRTGRTAPLKYSQLELSKWAEEYERQHGIHCAQRIDNNAERDRRTQERSQGNLDRPNFVEFPESQTRQQSALHRETLDRLERLRLEYDHRHMVERNVTTARHRVERDVHFNDAKSATGVALAYVRDRFKGRWRDLYDAQRSEAVHVNRIQSSPLDRAAFVMWNQQRLGGANTLSKKQRLRLIASPAALFKAVEAMHVRERRQLTNVQKAETHARLEKVNQGLEHRLAAQRVQHRAEIDAQRAEQWATKAVSVDYKEARQQVRAELFGDVPPRQAPNAPLPENDQQYIERTRADMAAHYKRNTSPATQAFHEWWREQQQTPPPQREPPAAAPVQAAQSFEQAAAPTRAQQIKMDMAAWREKNGDKDFGNER